MVATASVPGLLLTGVDSLVVGWPVHAFRFSDEEVKALGQAKTAAGEKLFGRGGAAFNWYGQDFLMKARGAQGYEWILENSDVSMRMAAQARGGKVFPELYLTFRSAYLWREGFSTACGATRDWLSTFADLGEGKVSRADLCADFAMPLPTINTGVDLVSRGRKKARHKEIEPREAVEWQSGTKETGYQVGKGDLVARVYNKREELQHTNKLWFEGLWRENGWDGEAAVTRFEFQFRRNVLKQFNVDSPKDLGFQTSEMWAYATEDWITVREPSDDTNRARWPVKPFWTDVQAAGACFNEVRTGITRHIQSRPEYNALLTQWLGLTKTLLGLDINAFGAEDRAWRRLEGKLREAHDDPLFQAQVRQRTSKLSHMAIPGLKAP